MKMNQREKGLTLLEAAVGVAIMAVVVVAVAMATTTILMNHGQAAEQNIALSQVQNAGFWISRDVQMAENITASDPNGFPLLLDIPVDMDENNNYSIEYLFEGNGLKRRVYDSSGNLTSETFIADYIDTGNTTFIAVDPGAGRYKLTVRASPNGTGVTRSYEITQRIS